MNLRILALAAILLAALVPSSASAAGPADLTPGNRWADATFTLTQPDLRTIQLSGDLVFYEYDVDGSRYTADDMGEAYVNANTFTRGPARGNELVVKIETQARSSLDSTLAAAFPTATRTVDPAVVDRTTLRVTGGNEYDPGVRITVGATVTRTNADLGLGTYSDAAVAAVFDAGAVVSNEFSLSSQAGYNSVYRILVPASPAGLVFANAAGQGASLSADGKTLTIAIDNTLGAATLTRGVTVDLRSATADAPSAEDIRAEVDIRLGEIKAGSAAIPVSTDVAAEVRSLAVATRYPGLLPSKVDLDHISAKALRDLRAAGAVTDEHLEKGDEALLGAIKDDLQASLKTAVTAKGGLVREHLAPTATGDAIGFAANATGAYAIQGAGAENLDLALRVGARVTFDIGLHASADRDTTYRVHSPAGLSFKSADKGVLSKDGRTLTVDAPAAGGEGAEIPVRLVMAQDGAPSFSAEKAELDVVVDLKDLDITIGRAVNGDMGDLVIDVTVTGNLNVIKVPDDLKSTFDERLELQYLPSDALRLLRERGILDDANLSKLEENLLAEVKNNLGAALGADVQVTGGLDRASLDPALVGDVLSGDKPVVFKAQASFRKSLSGAPSTQAAIALYTQQQEFTLPKVQGLDTVYTVILPPGLEVTDLQTTGGEKEVGESEDGRSQFTVRPSEDQARATVSMAVTPSFVVMKFWPILLLAVMVIVLLVGTPVALVVRGRKKKNAAAAAKAKK